MELLREVLGLLLALVFSLAPGAAGVEANPEADMEAHGKLVSCEFYEGGGMENQSLTMTLTRARSGGADLLTIERRYGNESKTETWPATWDALDDFALFVADYDPEGWEALPDSELIALDAPTRRLSVTYEDGAFYSVDDSRELPPGKGGLIWKAERFLESYAAPEAATFEIRFASFTGGGPEYWPVLSAPETVRWEGRVLISGGDESAPPGSGCEQIFVFHGRVPGETDLWFEMSDPLGVPVAGEELAPRVYHLTVDNDYNVTCTEDE